VIESSIIRKTFRGDKNERISFPEQQYLSSGLFSYSAFVPGVAFVIYNIINHGGI
jgi:hypothetical protein